MKKILLKALQITFRENLHLHGNDTLRQWDVLYVAMTPAGMLVDLEGDWDGQIKGIKTVCPYKDPELQKHGTDHPSKQHRSKKWLDLHTVRNTWSHKKE